MRLSAVLVSISLSSLVNAHPYVLEDDYEPASFFDMFDFFTSADPTHGYVSYVDRTTAQNDGLISNSNGSIYMGVDSTNVASGSGRASVRVTSKKTYNHGLIILDLSHMPGGICGTWPAFWTTGPSWPTNGEIDIIEGVNAATANGMTLHTDTGCSVSNRNNTQSGSLVTANCDVNAPGQATNAGCSIAATSLHTFGAGFNAMGGGVYAMEWTSAAISVYFFPRNAIPGDITSGTPDPSGWGAPQGMFSGACDIDSHVVDQKIVFDTTFCGDWAGNVWSTDAVCAPLAATCEAYVQNTPSAFVNAYWSVNSLRVYSASGTSPTTSTSTVSSTASLSFTTSTSSATSATSTSPTTSATPTSSTSSLTPTSSITSATPTSSTSSLILTSSTSSLMSTSSTSSLTLTSSITSAIPTSSTTPTTLTPSTNSATPTSSTTSVTTTPHTTSTLSTTSYLYPTPVSFTTLYTHSSSVLGAGAGPSTSSSDSESWSAQPSPWPTSQQPASSATWGTLWPAPSSPAPSDAHYSAYDSRWNQGPQGPQSSWGKRRRARRV